MKFKKKRVKKSQKYVNILGIKLLSTQKNGLLAGITQKISHNKKFYIVTPNPELVLASEDDKNLKNALNAADYAIPDGVGLNYATRFLGFGEINIIPGRKLFEDLIGLGYERGWKIFLLGGLGDEARGASAVLKIKHKGLKIRSFRGPILDKKGQAETKVNRKLEKDAVDRINRFSPNLLFVAMSNPKQEIWIHKNLPKLKVNCAMAVGGAFRYVAGMAKLPPKWMENLGLEWIHRLATDQKRIGRVLNAFPIFPLRVFWFKVSGS